MNYVAFHMRGAEEGLIGHVVVTRVKMCRTIIPGRACVGM